MTTDWPELSFQAWRETCAALHLYSQIVGKYRLARTPWLNHSWHATLYVDSRGLTTSLVPDRPGGIEIRMDLIEHAVIGTATSGRSARFALEPMSVADFHRQFLDLLRALDGTPQLHGRPNEVPSPVPFAEDRGVRPYDSAAVGRFFSALVRIDAVLKQFRTGFIGKASPVHLFWGSFDLAVTRFSGRPAAPHPGGIPYLPDDVTREAYSHEVSSAGFWPGGAGVEHAVFYSYAYPPPPGFADAEVAPAEACYDARLGEFLLPYDDVRRSPEPERTLLAFLESTYRAAADLGRWDRQALETPLGVPLRPRPASQS